MTKIKTSVATKKQKENSFLSQTAPLADRMRPRTLDEFAGQEHILSAGRLLRRAIQADQLSSLIFFGPPGSGKTTLAQIIANTTKAKFLSLNAVLSGIKDIRDRIDQAEKCFIEYKQRAILFIDEVHRFNKAQQDALLPHVETGKIILIGATTENPYFEVNKALVSRSRVFQLKTLGENNLEQILNFALADKERGYGQKKITLEEEAKKHLIKTANGDARALLNALELAVITSEPDQEGVIYIHLAVAEDSIQQKAVLYDKDGDAHFDTISAFIKSLRGSDPDAALYWMAKMIYSGEDPRFIFRRMLILAAEDVGLADPSALGVVVSAAQAFDYVGMPEGRFHLAQACIHLATAPKSNSTLALFDALKSVKKEKDDEIPNHLKDPSRDKKTLGHGQNYLYPHAYRDHWVAQQYLPNALQGRIFYQPSDQGRENHRKNQVLKKRESRLAAILENPNTNQQNIGEQYWRERTLGDADHLMAEIRDHLLSIAQVRRNDLILNLNAGNALFIGELTRQAPEGVIHAMVNNNEEKKVLEELFKNKETLCKPVILDLSKTQKNLCFASLLKEKIKFDMIIGGNFLSATPDNKSFLPQLKDLLKIQGKLALVERIPALGQKLSELIPWNVLSGGLKKQFLMAEKSILEDPDNIKVNWNDQTLLHNCQIEGLEIQTSQKLDFQTKVFILPQKINKWFSSRYLPKYLSDDEIQLIKQSTIKQIGGKTVKWKSAWMFLMMTKNN